MRDLFDYWLPSILPPEATDTIYVSNLPEDATQREIAHVFKTFLGFQQCYPCENRSALIVFESALYAYFALLMRQHYNFHFPPEPSGEMILRFFRRSSPPQEKAPTAGTMRPLEKDMSMGPTR